MYVYVCMNDYFIYMYVFLCMWMYEYIFALKFKIFFSAEFKSATKKVRDTLNESNS